MAGVVYGVMSVSALVSRDDGRPLVGLIVAFGLILWSGNTFWQLSRWRWEWFLDRQLRTGAYVLGDYTIILDAEGAEEITPTGRSKVAWQDVVGMYQDHVFIIIQYLPAGRGFVTPKRAFPTPHDMAAFHDTAVNYWRAASDGAAFARAAKEGIWPPPPRRTV